MATTKKPSASTAIATAKTTTASTKTAAKTAVDPKLQKPIKTVLNKTALVTHIAEVAGVDVKSTKSVIAALESTIAASLSKKGLGGFTLPGLLKISVIQVPAKKKHIGIDRFTKLERSFPAKPASTKIKLRALKKLKDAAL